MFDVFLAFLVAVVFVFVVGLAGIVVFNLMFICADKIFKRWPWMDAG